MQPLLHQAEEAAGRRPNQGELIIKFFGALIELHCRSCVRVAGHQTDVSTKEVGSQGESAVA